MFKAQIKNIFFDFDGVILDSVDSKTEAFYKMYVKYGEKIAEEVKMYHLQNGGISRFEKFKYWEKKYFNKTINNNEVNLLANEFSGLVYNNVINSKKIQGVIDFLKNYHTKLNLFIITGTPTDEIIQICNNLNISKYFKEIKGSPETKIHWTEYLIKEYKLERSETIFLGDANTDFKASVHSKLRFALREADYNIDYFKKIDVFKFNNYKDLENYIDEKL